MLPLSVKHIKMKKVFTLIFIAVFVMSCDVNSDPVEITASTSITESVSISIPQSNASVDYDETINQDLNNVISNLSQVSSINIDNLSYRYLTASGNSAATITSATLSVNGVTVSTISNVNISQAAQAGTVFEITDTNVLDQLETIFLNNSSVTIQFSGSAVDGPIDFNVEVSISLTATL